MATSKKSIETTFSFHNDNAKFSITLIMHSEPINSFDFVTEQQNLGTLIEGVIKGLSEPIGCIPIHFDILVYNTIVGTQKLFVTPYRAVIEVTALSFPDSKIPFKILGYPELELSERVYIKGFDNFMD